MNVFRPIREGDLPGLVSLSRSTGGGLTTLPANEEFLAGRIYDSVRSFNPRVGKPGAEYYLFVLEDTVSGEIVGTSGICARVGGFDPWYSYQIRRERFAHPPLKIEKEIAVLHLKEEYRGPSEVCSLFLRADSRREGNGRLLSLARLLFIGGFRRRFTDTVIAEMRGYIDPSGKSPFWEAVGRHFFEHDFYAADVLSGLGEKEFIADLMPRHPLYVPLLSADVQAVLGRVHHDTEPALALLRAEGFTPMGEIDIFDGGPLMQAEVSRLRTLVQSRAAPVREVLSTSAEIAGLPHLLANTSLEFRACVGAVSEHPDGTVALSRPQAKALQLAPGDTLRFSPLR
ncbi:MAG: arginine succinyltransferase [Verrucomicrobia bacterium]|nr:arginine succinyltransferase [Verrucomicrobiota bacterium]